MSRHSREAYEAALLEMRAVVGGRVKQIDFLNASGRYRRAEVEVEADHLEAASVADDLAQLALEIRGHLTMYVSDEKCLLNVSVSRNLSPEEIGGLMASREIEGGGA